MVLQYSLSGPWIAFRQPRSVVGKWSCIASTREARAKRHLPMIGIPYIRDGSNSRTRKSGERMEVKQIDAPKGYIGECL